MNQTRRIEPQFFSKIWGTPHIDPWFAPRGEEKTGEVWFPANDLLIKFLFTSGDLSVQVHPDDQYARVNENSRGKTEAWHILRTDPGARIALGFNERIDRERIVPLAESGEIMDLLNWIAVSPGETYFVPPGTVHAIGAGVALCEIQQYSDITYRLYDYGRGRELHLRAAGDVARAEAHPGRSEPKDLGDGVRLWVDCEHFRIYSATAEEPVTLREDFEGRVLVILEGRGVANGLAVAPGQVLETGGLREWVVEPDASSGPMKVLLVA